MLARKSRRGDAGIFTDAADKWVVLVLSLLVAGIVAMTVAMWLRRKDIRVRAKQLHLVTVQTVASVVWFVGVVVRNGHVRRTEDSIFFLSNCDLWWFWITMIGGFGVWAACIFIRLLRLRQVFFFGSPLTMHWSLLIFLMDSPFILIYGLIMPMTNAIVYRREREMCLYGSGIYVSLDFAVVFSVLFLLILLIWQLREIKDHLNENKSVRKATVVAIVMFSLTLLVHVFKLDYNWYGRAIETSAVVGAITAFHVFQSGEAVFPVLNRTFQVQLDSATVRLADADVESPEADLPFQQPLPGSTVLNMYTDEVPAFASSASSPRFASAVETTRHRQRLFSRTVLGEN